MKTKVIGWGGAATAASSIPFFALDPSAGLVSLGLGVLLGWATYFKNVDETPFYIKTYRSGAQLGIYIRRRSSASWPDDARKLKGWGNNYYGNNYNAKNMLFRAVDPLDDDAVVEAIVDAQTLLKEWENTRNAMSNAERRARKLLKA